MKLTRIFGIVLGLHVGVILLVMMQPGCQSAKQGNLSDENASTSVTPDPLDSFNEGTVEEEKPESKPAPVFVSPTRPKPGEIIIPGQRDPIDPAPTVDAVAGVTETIPCSVRCYCLQDPARRHALGNCSEKPVDYAATFNSEPEFIQRKQIEHWAGNNDS